MNKTFNKPAMTLLIILLALTSPLSTDINLPALSTIAADFGIPYSQANLIIIVYFFFMALCTLIAGPLSDRYGRKKVMVTSLLLYAFGNLVCVLSGSIALLVFGRAVSACGAGGMLNTSTALTKDVFTGRDRDRTLAIVQVFQIMGPLVAPVIGASLLAIANWHACFIVLVAVSCVELAVAISQPETQPEDQRNLDSTIGGLFKPIGTIMHNRAFVLMLLCVGALQACFMAYLATSSYIYQVDFGVSPGTYSLFFSLNALVTMTAPMFYMKVLYDRLKPVNIYRLAQSGVLLGSILICIVGFLQANGMLSALGAFAPVLFWISFAIISFSNSIARPLGVSTLLKQHSSATGTLSALINFGLYIIGLVGMCLGSIDWPSYIVALGVIVMCIIAIAIVLFFIVTRPSVGLKWEDD